MNKNKDKRIVMALVLGLVLLDQIIKIIMLISNFNFENEFIKIGIILSEKCESNIQYILISIIAGTTLIRYVLSKNKFIKLKNKVILSFAIAGVISNLIDRIINGYVINYIFISGFTNFNISYVYIVITWIGMAILLTIHTSKAIREKRR